MALDNILYKETFRYLPLGLFILDSKHHILAWNHWLETKTEFTEAMVLGKTIKDIYPDLKIERFAWALDQIFNLGAPQVLSQILNHYLIPIPLQKESYTDLDTMQQHVEILPLKKDNEWYALVTIQDVTSNVHQKNVLMQMGHKLEENSYRDLLTNIYNRRFLWEYLEKQLAKSQADALPTACIMFDLDHFKYVNDEFGHNMGDKILQLFVNLTNKITRATDVFVRYGGEEFIVIIPEGDEEQAFQLAERVRVSFPQATKKLLDGREITCSAGISIWSPARPELSAYQLVDLADKAMYTAKNSGRNCIKISRCNAKK